MRNRTVEFAVCSVIILALFWRQIHRIVGLSMGTGYTSYVILVPFLTAYLIWLGRERIFGAAEYSRVWGGIIAALALILYLATTFALGARTESLKEVADLSSVLLFLVGAFTSCFGVRALRNAAFPIMLLALMVPVPGVLIDKVVFFLQSGSADLSYWMFELLGVPVLRDGFVLMLPGVSIEIAKECSGINSSIALLIIMLLVAHETLHSTWRRVLLVLITIPLSILKNAIRIVTLTMLATHVDPGFLNGRLHHEGGFVFYLISLALVYPIWKLLQKTEKPRSIPSPPQEVLTTS